MEVCAVLHNICKDMNIQLPPEEDGAAADIHDLDHDGNPHVDENQPAPLFLADQSLRDGSTGIIFATCISSKLYPKEFTLSLDI